MSEICHVFPGFVCAVMQGIHIALTLHDLASGNVHVSEQTRHVDEHVHVISCNGNWKDLFA